MRLSGSRGPPLSSSQAMSWVGIVFALDLKVAVVYIASNLPSTKEREALGAQALRRLSLALSLIHI